MLKLSLPGVDPNSLPTLTADEAKGIPPKLLEELIENGHLQDYGDLRVLTIEDEKHHATILWVMDWILHGEQAPFLQHGALEVLRKGPNDRPITFVPVSHEEDTDIVTTSATHEAFRQTTKLYMLSLHADMKDLQAHLSSTIVNQHPVYAAEIVVLLTELASAKRDIADMNNIDSDMLAFIGRRILCLRDTLPSDRELLPLLRSIMSAHERCMSISLHVDPEVVERAHQYGVSESAQTAALLNTLIELKSDVTSSNPSIQTDEEILPPKITPRTLDSTVQTKTQTKPHDPATFRCIKPDRISQDEWDSYSTPLQQRHHHYGEIHERNEGQPAVVPCKRCIEKSRKCRFYKVNEMKRPTACG